MSAPPWFTPSKATPTLTANVERGRHPFGFELSEVLGARCRTCQRCYRRQGGIRSFYKCEMVEATARPDTDVRLKWQACEHWYPQSEGTRCEECAGRLLAIIRDGRLVLVCNGCGGMFPAAVWQRSSRCTHETMVDERALRCVLPIGHRGGHRHPEAQ